MIVDELVIISYFTIEPDIKEESVHVGLDKVSTNEM